MRLWTYHPLCFRIDDPGLVIDPMRGDFWKDQTFQRYKSALPTLYEILGTDQFLWCCTAPSNWCPTNARPVCEWELNIPDSQILEFLWESAWHSILMGHGDDWANVIIKQRPVQPDRLVSALVQLPLSPGWTKLNDKSLSDLQQQFVQSHRDLL